MIDQALVDCDIVFESRPNLYHADLCALNYDAFPDEIPTQLGNEKPFTLFKVKYFKNQRMHIATYKQPDSKAVLLVYEE
jgi:hypothetical protein